VPSRISGIDEVAPNPEYTAALGLLLWKTQSEDYNHSFHNSAITIKDVSNKVGKWFKEFF
jgi:hypothetical protein